MPIYTFKLVAFLTVLTSESTGVGGFSLHVCNQLPLNLWPHRSYD